MANHARKISRLCLREEKPMIVRKVLSVLAVASALGVSACAGKLDYYGPTSPSSVNHKIIDRDREQVWNDAIPRLGETFFVINNMDKSSGFINMSYSGDPGSYIDCGRITSVENARGERTYDSPAAKEHQIYEVMADGFLLSVYRKMSLEGRVNLILEEIGPNQTKVTVNIRYIVNRTVEGKDMFQDFPVTRTDSISFNSGAGAHFPENIDGRVTRCVPNGILERKILSAIK